MISDDVQLHKKYISKYLYGTKLLVTEVVLFMSKFYSSAYFKIQKLPYMAIQLPVTEFYSISIHKYYIIKNYNHY